MPGFEAIDSREKKALNNLFREGGTLMAHGFQKLRKKYHVREFESACEKYFGVKKALAVTSGTAGIKIALRALNIKRGDEVITQSFNFIATIEAILDIGAKPIIVNVNETLNMSPDELSKKITKKTKAVIPVHMLGVSAEMDQIIRICKKKKVPVIEDNCEAIGGKYNNKFLGAVGDVGIFSFDHGKIITTGEGGMLLTNNKSIDKISREYHDHGHENNSKYNRGNDTKKIYGFNYRMTEMQGAIGKVQLSKLKWIIRQNRVRFKILSDKLNKKYNLRKIPKKSIPNFDTFILFEKNFKIRRKIINVLKKNSLGTKNLPDAIKWHCSYYWSHAISKQEVRNSLKTKKILKSAIAVPILIKKRASLYSKIAKEIFNIKS